MKTITLISFCLALAISTTFGQKGPARYFGEPVLTDSLSTLFIPTRYNEDFLAVNKIALWGDYNANLIVYNFQTDTYIKLFEQDTFIESFRRNNYSNSLRSHEKIKNITKQWVFLLVKTKDTNNSGRIDEKDPSILFAVSTSGQNLKQITTEKENVVSFEVYEKQGFLLVKIQKDTNNDNSFKADDKEYYYRKVSLTDLTLGNAIEIK